LNAENIVGQ